VWCDILREREGCGYDVFVEKIDVVAFGVRGVVVEWQISGEHSVLQKC
jgi:hypothetical protein